MSFELGAYVVNPYRANIDASFVKGAHNRELRVYPWMVNEPRDILGMLEMGLDGVISEFPDRVPKA